jgi:hypothetical protein
MACRAALLAALFLSLLRVLDDKIGASARL